MRRKAGGVAGGGGAGEGRGGATTLLLTHHPRKSDHIFFSGNQFISINRIQYKVNRTIHLINVNENRKVIFNQN